MTRTLSLRRGFTLVEMLVVIAVMGILVAILLPAIQAAREAARRTQCTNNHRQVALAVFNHVSAHDRLPALRNPRYYSDERRVGWCFTILPFMEELAIHETLAAEHWRIDELRTSTGERPAFVSAFQCPSYANYPHFANKLIVRVSDGEVLFDRLGVAHLKASSGVTFTTDFEWRKGAWYGPSRSKYDEVWRDDSHLYEGAKLQYITDGLSQTVLIAEQARDSAVPFPVDQGSDFLDIINTDLGLISQHPAGVHAAMCDGAVRFLSNDTSREIMRALLTRAEGDLVDLSGRQPVLPILWSPGQAE